MKAGRNPRRAYDEHGNEIPPTTVGDLKSTGFKTAMAYCNGTGCHHGSPVSLAGLPDELPIPDIALRLRCAACGSKDVKTMLNINEHYAICDEWREARQSA